MNRWNPLLTMANHNNAKPRRRRWAVLLVSLTISLPGAAAAADLRVMKTGLGEGVIGGTGISCGIMGGTVSGDCNEPGIAPTTTVNLTVTVGADSRFTAWGGDCASVVVVPPATPPCNITMSAMRSVRANFDRVTSVPSLTDFTPEGIRTYLNVNPNVDSPAEFLAALPVEFKRNWILMPRSESLQTGIAGLPRFLLPSADATRVFTFGLSPSHASYPGAHPGAIEYMQWDATEKNFRFHEIVIVPPGAANAIPAMHDLDPGPGVRLAFGARERGVAADDQKCFACHSTRNVINLNPARNGPGTTPGTTGITPQTVKHKNKPNWDTYDSWGGQLAFNRDRIYKGSVEAAAFRKLFNLWTWQTNEAVRALVEQLDLQPPGVPNGTTIIASTGVADHRIRRDVFSGGENDGHIVFGFDPAGTAVTVELTPTGTVAPGHTAYEFNEAAGTGSATDVVKNGDFLTLHHSLDPTNDEGRGVELFDRLTVGPNPTRIADEMIPRPPSTDYSATGNVAIDVRPFAIAIADGCLGVAGGTNPGATQTITGLSTALAAKTLFFNARNGLTFDQVYDDTRRRAQSLTRRKADIERTALDRDADVYVYDPAPFDGVPIAPPDRVNGLIREYGAGTSGVTGGAGGLDLSFLRLRQEIFRRSPPPGHMDETVMGRIYVDREDDSSDGTPDNTAKVALFRYFLEPLGVSVDKWSMGVRGRSRTYTFADLLSSVTGPISTDLRASAGLVGASCAIVMTAVNTQIARLPAADAAPTFTDIQRIFNKSCIECHGGLGYPPYHTYGTSLDFTENENPLPTDPFPRNRRLGRSYALAASMTAAPTGTGANCTDYLSSYMFSRITDGCTFVHPYSPGSTATADERCPNGVMPCGGPPLSKTDIETIRRWIKGSTPPTYSEGDPHIQTVEGVNYDFQSAGEFTLLRDEGMELQARQTAVTTAGPLGPNPYTGLSSCVSINTAVAVRVGGHRVTYQPEIKGRSNDELAAAQDQRHRLVLRIDGQPAMLDRGEIALSRGGRIKRAPAPDAIQIEVPGGTRVVVTPGWWTSHQIWYMNINVRHARAVEGVMGAITPDNWLPALASGDQLGPRPPDLAQRHRDLYETFANSWRVDDASSLFDYEPDLSARSFVVPDWPVAAPQGCLAPPQPGGPPVVPAPTPMTQADAERHCAAIVDPERRGNCVQDLMATGEPGFVETYLATERLERRTAPPAPVLVFPADNSRISPAKVNFEWAKPPGVGAIGVSYRHCIWNADEMFDLNRCVKLDGPLVAVLPPDLAQHLTPEVCRACLITLIVIVIVIAVVLIFRFKRSGLLPTLILAAIVLAILFALCRMSAQVPLKTSVADVQPGKVYFWKVVAETTEGITVESRTRRFEVKD